MPLPLAYPNVLLRLDTGKSAASYDPVFPETSVVYGISAPFGILASSQVAEDFEFIGDIDGDMHGWTVSLTYPHIFVTPPADVLARITPGYVTRVLMVYNLASDPVPGTAPTDVWAVFTADFTFADVSTDGIWIPVHGFDPPGGWHWGDPPPSPWMDGDAPPDGWTPPDGYVPDVCTFDIAPTDAGYDYLAHSAVFLLTASGIHCESTPTTPNLWITLGETADIGTYNVPYAITQNNGAFRSGVIYVGGSHFIITQAGRPADHSGGDVPPPPVVYTKGPPCSATYTRGPDYDAGDYTRGSDPCGG